MSKAHVEQLVPHRGTMSWLDRIVSVDADGAVAEADIRPGGFFVRDGGLPAWAGIEYMAQTVAAWAGHRARSEGRQVDIGFLVGSRRYESTRPVFPVGACLHIQVARELIADNGLGMFACRILIDGSVVASANLSVFEPPEGAAFLLSQGENT
ncbi:hypothetical protein [Aquabacterium sp.]|uniref:ApeP family dehydratase n=1 Tax=Aquabacterium sp. TaxID=1872578 RepID=UPI003D6C850D